MSTLLIFSTDRISVADNQTNLKGKNRTTKRMFIFSCCSDSLEDICADGRSLSSAIFSALSKVGIFFLDTTCFSSPARHEPGSIIRTSSQKGEAVRTVKPNGPDKLLGCRFDRHTDDADQLICLSWSGATSPMVVLPVVLAA